MNLLSARTFIHQVLFVIVVSACGANVGAAEKPVNLVILLADDLGYNGLGCYGSDLHETPELDRLATQSMKFTDAYAACTVCSPTRASIMTGKYPARLHLTDFIAGQRRPHEPVLPPLWTTHLPHSEITLAEALRQRGYRTAHIGKWHLDPPRGTLDRDDFEPVDHGFHEQSLKPAARGYFLHANKEQGIEEGEFLTDYLTDRALDFLERSAEGPFFLYLAYHTPHTPIEAPSDLTAQYRLKLEGREHARIHQNPVYAAMVEKLDHSVGRILAKLDALGVAQNTVVWFTSDNGGLTDRYGQPTGFTNNAPLRRGKGSAYEGGIRVPLLIRWPGVSKPGAVCRSAVSTIDIFPTLVDIAGGVVDLNSPVDGKSLVPLLNDPTATLDRAALYWHYPHYHAGGDGPHGSIRQGDWKLIERFDREQVELYHLAEDLGEQHDLSKSEPARTALLLQALAAWRKEVDAQMPRPNPAADAAKAKQLVAKRAAEQAAP